MLDAKITWKDHLIQLCRSVHSLIYRQFFSRKRTILGLCKHLEQALLFLIIDYCSLVYCGLSQEVDPKLQRLVKRRICYIHGVRSGEHTTQHRHELQWLTTVGSREYFIACFLSKLFNTAVLYYIITFFDFHVALRPVRSEVTSLDIPTFAFRRHWGTHISASSIWNSLPSHLRSNNYYPISKHWQSNHFLIYKMDLDLTNKSNRGYAETSDIRSPEVETDNGQATIHYEHQRAGSKRTQWRNC